MSVWLKLCGFTREEDVRAAMALDIDAMGFIFAPGSKRRMEPAEAKALINHLPPTICPVGVFVNAGIEMIRAVIAETGIRMAQLHGDESPDLVAALPVPVIKGFRTGPLFRPETVGPFRGTPVLIDGFKAGEDGGTGQLADWTIVAAIATSPVILSGGLTSENVGRAIRTVRPYGVDVSSGIESAPGIKSAEKMRAFVEAARAVE